MLSRVRSNTKQNDRKLHFDPGFSGPAQVVVVFLTKQKKIFLFFSFFVLFCVRQTLSCRRFGVSGLGPVARLRSGRFKARNAFFDADEQVSHLVSVARGGHGF